MSNSYTDTAIQNIVEQEVNKVLEDIQIEIMSSWLVPELDDEEAYQRRDKTFTPIDGFNLGLHVAASKIEMYRSGRTGKLNDNFNH